MPRRFYSNSEVQRSGDERYLAVLQDALRICQEYKPRFGQRASLGLLLTEFRELYGQDAFYSWFGLDSPLVYAAHRAAGGITSVYRQIGTGCERVFRLLLQDTLGLAPEQASWSYTTPTARGKKTRRLSMDARIVLSDVQEETKRKRLSAWLESAGRFLRLKEGRASVGLNGVVFEVRQGYKSKDAKRQNADISNGAAAYAHGYLPVVMILSNQIDLDVADRYLRAKLLVLRGTNGGSDRDSTYVFCRNVLNYDLAGFFRRNAPALKTEVRRVLEGLLR